MFTVADVFDLAIRLEKNGERYYRHFANAAHDPEIKRILSWLAEQEVQHAVFFGGLKQGSAEHPATFSEPSPGMALEDYLGDHALALEEVDLSSLTDPHQVLRHALEFENDTILFFDMIRAFITEEAALTQLDAIIHEERHHIRIIDNLLDQYPSAKPW